MKKYLEDLEGVPLSQFYEDRGLTNSPDKEKINALRRLGLNPNRAHMNPRGTWKEYPPKSKEDLIKLEGEYGVATDTLPLHNLRDKDFP